MRIGIISSQVFACPPIGYAGLEMVAYQQAKGLAARGHAVTLFAPEGSRCEGATVVPTGPPGQWDEQKSYSTYWQHLSNFDVILDHSWNKWSYVLKGEGRLPAPVLGWCHAPVNTLFGSFPPGIDKPCFVCISDDQKNHFEALHGRPCRRCYNGVDPGVYKPLGIPRTNRYLFLARFSSVKSPDLAQDVCLAAGAGLDMVGDTSITNEPELLKKCQQRADGKQIKLVGPCTRGEAVYWMSQAHGFLSLTKHFREPFGLAPIEAQLVGLPIIGWGFGSLPEIIEHGKTGFLVTSLEEAIDLVKSDAVRTIDRDYCRHWASQFSVNAMITRCEELIQEAISGGW